METAQQRRGRRAEELACESLRAAGWTIIQHNLRVAGLEIDLLARDERRLLVAVEVRARLRVGEQSPRALLGARKVAAFTRGPTAPRTRESIAGVGGTAVVCRP